MGTKLLLSHKLLDELKTAKRMPSNKHSAKYGVEMTMPKRQQL